MKFGANKWSHRLEVTDDFESNSNEFLVFFRYGRSRVMLPLWAKRPLVQGMSEDLEWTHWNDWIPWTRKFHSPTTTASVLAWQDHWRIQRLWLLRSPRWLCTWHVRATLPTNGHIPWTTRKTLSVHGPNATTASNEHARTIITWIPLVKRNVHSPLTPRSLDEPRRLWNLRGLQPRFIWWSSSEWHARRLTDPSLCTLLTVSLLNVQLKLRLSREKKRERRKKKSLQASKSDEKERISRFTFVFYSRKSDISQFICAQMKIKYKIKYDLTQNEKFLGKIDLVGSEGGLMNIFIGIFFSKQLLQSSTKSHSHEVDEFSQTVQNLQFKQFQISK